MGSDPGKRARDTASRVGQKADAITKEAADIVRTLKDGPPAPEPPPKKRTIEIVIKDD
jgi:hypothetical protein